MLAHFRDADENLQQALGLSSSNPLLAGACHLHRARCLHRMQRHDEAISEFEAWRRHKPHIEDGMTLQLGVEVEFEIRGSIPRFEIDVSQVFSSSIDDLERHFRGWVLKQYIEKYGDKWGERASHMLGKGKSTLYTWADSLGVGLPTESKKKRYKRIGPRKSPEIR